MNKKPLDLLENNVQYVTLGLGCAFLGWVSWAYVVNQPAEVSVAGRNLTGGEVDKFYAENAAAQFNAVHNTPGSALSIAIPKVNAILSQFAAPPTSKPWHSYTFDSRGLGQVIKPLSGADLAGSMTAIKIESLPTLPPGEALGVVHGLSTVNVAPPQQGNPVPSDRDWITAAFTVDMAKVDEAFKAVKLDSRFPTLFLRVVVEREEQTGGGAWSNRVLVAPLANTTLVAYPDKAANAPFQAAYLEWAKVHQPDILQPAFYQVLGGAQWSIPGQEKAAPTATFDPRQFLTGARPSGLTEDQWKLVLDAREKEVARKAEEAKKKAEEAAKNKRTAPGYPGYPGGPGGPPGGPGSGPGGGPPGGGPPPGGPPRGDAGSIPLIPGLPSAPGGWALPGSQTSDVSWNFGWAGDVSRDLLLLQAPPPPPSDPRTGGGPPMPGRGSLPGGMPGMPGGMPGGVPGDPRPSMPDMGGGVGLPGMGGRPPEAGAAGREAAPVSGELPSGLFTPGSFKTITCWAHDEGLDSGKSYRYRMVYKLLNPVFDQPNSVAKPELATVYEMASAASPWTASVAVDPRVSFFLAKEVNGTANSVEFELYRFENGTVRKSSAVARAGDMVGATDAAGTYVTGYTLIDIRKEAGNAPASRATGYILLLDPAGNVVRRTFGEDRLNGKRAEMENAIKAATAAPSGDNQGR